MQTAVYPNSNTVQSKIRLQAKSMHSSFLTLFESPEVLKTNA